MNIVNNRTKVNIDLLVYPFGIAVNLWVIGYIKKAFNIKKFIEFGLKAANLIRISVINNRFGEIVIVDEILKKLFNVEFGFYK